MKKANKLNVSSLKAFVASLEDIRNECFSREKCEAKGLFRECSPKIIRSHSISRKFLKLIADGTMHVYCFDNHLFNLMERGGKAGVKKVGCNEASTYQMFCGYHDNELFLPIEKNNELIPNEHQCQRLMYRALMMEKYLKESQVKYVETLIQLGNKLKKENNVVDEQYLIEMRQEAMMAIKDFEVISVR